MGYMLYNVKKATASSFLPLTLGFILLITLSSSGVQGQTVQSATQTKTFSDFYSASWYTYNDNAGDVRIQVTLKITNVDYSTWSAQSQSGYWLGVGFGKTSMTGADIVICSFKYTAQTTDKFVCTDRYSSGSNFEPSLDTTDDVTDVSSTSTYTASSSKVALTAVFQRKLNTKDLNSQDYTIGDGDTFDGIWANGQIISNTLQGHTSVSTMRGSFRMQLNSLKASSSKYFSALSSMLVVAFASFLITML